MDDEKLKNFLKFIGSPKARTYYYLFNNVIREPNIEEYPEEWDEDFHTEAMTRNAMYDYYYSEGLLVASATQKKIASFLGISTSTVASHIKALTVDEDIKTTKSRYLVEDPYGINFYVNVYIVGFIKDGKEYYLNNNKYGNYITNSMHREEVPKNNNIRVRFFGGVN